MPAHPGPAARKPINRPPDRQQLNPRTGLLPQPADQNAAFRPKSAVAAIKLETLRPEVVLIDRAGTTRGGDAPRTPSTFQPKGAAVAGQPFQEASRLPIAGPLRTFRNILMRNAGFLGLDQREHDPMHQGGPLHIAGTDHDSMGLLGDDPGQDLIGRFVG